MSSRPGNDSAVTAKPSPIHPVRPKSEWHLGLSAGDSDNLAVPDTAARYLRVDATVDSRSAVWA